MDCKILIGAVKFNEGLFDFVINDIAGHIVLSRKSLLKKLNIPFDLSVEYDEVYKRGGIFDRKRAEDFSEIIGNYKRSTNLLKKALEESQKTQDSAEEDTKLNSYLLHESYHIGQIGILRKYMGKEGIK